MSQRPYSRAVALCNGPQPVRDELANKGSFWLTFYTNYLGFKFPITANEPTCGIPHSDRRHTQGGEMRKPFLRTSCTASLLLAMFSSLLACGSDAGEKMSFVASPAVTTYYISLSGSDSNDGTLSTTPFLTWAKAFGVLNPGDTLVVKGGIYGANNGVADVRCGGEDDDYTTWTSASRCLTGPPYRKCGTCTAPITVRADEGQERLAYLQVAGVSKPYGGTWAGLRVLNCAYWEFHGLRVQGGDNPSNTGVSGVVDVWNSDHITLKRLLVHDTNRYANQHTLRVYKSSDVLVEETEAYNYRAHGFIATQSSRVIFRRNYANCNRYENIEGGFPQDKQATDPNIFPVGKNCSPATDINPNGTTVVQGAGFAFYPAEDSLMENNVAEHTSWGFLNLAATATNGLRTRRGIASMGTSPTPITATSASPATR